MKWGWRITMLMWIGGGWKTILKNRKRYRLDESKSNEVNEEKD